MLPIEREFIYTNDKYPGNCLTNVGHNIFGWDATVNKGTVRSVTMISILVSKSG
jgi:hypothetical protein